MSRIIGKVVSKLESLPKPLIFFILAFLFIVILRLFLESLVPPNRGSYFLRDEFFLIFSHFSLFYICIALAIILFFYLITKEKIDKITKVVLPVFLIIIFPPIIDTILSSGKGLTMTYILPEWIEGFKSLFLKFLTFGGSLIEVGEDLAGITPSLKIEVGLVILLSFFYLKLKTKSIKKSLIGSFLLYCLFFIFAILPIILKSFLNFLNISYHYSHILMINSYLFLIFILLLLVFFIRNKKELISLIKDIRPLRLLSYYLIFILGIILARPDFPKLILNQDNVFYFLFILISVALLWLFLLIKDNIEDIDIDKITNNKRPLVGGEISLGNYQKIAYLVLVFSLIFALAVNFQTFFFVLCLIGAGFLYSMHPFKLGRITFFSKIIIGFNFLILLIIGYFFAGGDLVNFPKEITFFLLVPFAACVNLIDLKDYQADKAAEIKTLPVVLGLKKSKFYIGILFLITYVSFPFLFGLYQFWLFGIFFGVLSFLIINKEKYNEKLVLLTFIISLILLLNYLKFFII